MGLQPSLPKFICKNIVIDGAMHERGGGKFIFIMKLVASPLASTLLKWLYPSASEDNILLNW